MKALSRIATVMLLWTGISCKSVVAPRADHSLLVDGNWMLRHLYYEGVDGAEGMVLFDDAEDLCFRESMWFFRRFSGTVSYVLKPNELCGSMERTMEWDVNAPILKDSPEILLKYTGAGGRLGLFQRGQRMVIDHVDKAQMTLKATMVQGGRPVTVVYEFIKQ